MNPRHTLEEYLGGIKDYLFYSMTSEASVTTEILWVNPMNQENKKHFSIKFSKSLFMNQQVIVINVTDMTDRDSLIEAEASNKHKTFLLSSVSHELRTPLNGSINFIEQALNNSTIPDEIKEKWLTPAIRCNYLLLSLVNDILDFSQMQAGKLRLVFEPRNIVKTAQESIELLQLQAAKKHLKLELQNNLADGSETFSSDHNRLKQVMLNLLSNAVKFTFEGKITLILENISTLLDTDDSSSIIKGVKISCKDTGIGLSSENQKKLFKAFEKIDFNNNHNMRAQINPTGAGLGLVISNNIVQRLNPPNLQTRKVESIKFHSVENVGTTFFLNVFEQEEIKITLTERIEETQEQEFSSERGIESHCIEELNREMPQNFTDHNPKRIIIIPNRLIQSSSCSVFPILNRSPLLSQPSKQFRSLYSIKNPQECNCPKVLIVDDDSFNVIALEQILSKLEIPCHAAYNGQQAIEKIVKRQNNGCSPCCQQYRVVFLDCSMPILDGFETSKLLRQMIRRGEIDDLRIIACTAFVQQADEDKARAAGMDEFCTKPINLMTVKGKLSKAGFQV